jgi:hypothetical protein
MALAAACAGPAAGQEVTFSKDVAPILWKHCAACHRPGDIGPFPLTAYKDAAKRARHLKQVTADRRMPPWKPEPGYGDFKDERRLTNGEIALIAKWADGGASEGDPAELPPLPKFPDGWRLGEPDAVFQMPQPFEVPATGPDVYRCFVIPTKFTEDRWVVGIEYRPGNRRVVHHANTFIDTGTGQARKLEGKDGKPGYASFGAPGAPVRGVLGGWAPGASPLTMPAGIGRKVPRGSDLILMIHYHPTGKPETDQTSFALYFAKDKVWPLAGLDLRVLPISIPAGEKRFRLHDSYTLPAAVEVFRITPHMHLLGREMKVTATLPDGTVKPMIWIKDWDFNWQGAYTYKDRVALPKGTKLEMEAFFDNSADNPQNPNDPPKRVISGISSTDEMCECVLHAVPDETAGYAALAKEQAQRMDRWKQDVLKFKKTLTADPP